MRVNKQLLSMLDEKSRKEYLERKEKLFQDYNPLQLFITFITYSIYTIALFLIVLPLWKLAFSPEAFIAIFDLYGSILRVLWMAIKVGLMVDVIILFAILYKLDEIKKEYFTISYRVRKK